jgi:hypothetical protein
MGAAWLEECCGLVERLLPYETVSVALTWALSRIALQGYGGTQFTAPAEH